MSGSSPADEIRAPDAGAAGRRNRRRRRPAQLGADPLDPRAAYPAREGDEQHLHQFGPLRARLLHPSRPARRGRPRRLATLNHANAVQLADRLSEIPGVEILNARFFNEFTMRTPRPAADVIEALAKRGVIGGLPVSRLPPRRGARRLHRRRQHGSQQRDDRAAYATRWRNACKRLLEGPTPMNSQGRPTRPGPRAPRAEPSPAIARSRWRSR